MEKRSRRISPVMLEQRDVKDHFRVEVYCSEQPRPSTIDFDSGLVDRNPPRLAVGGSETLSASRCTHWKIA
jgi:hypothetical protein